MRRNGLDPILRPARRPARRPRSEPIPSWWWASVGMLLGFGVALAVPRGPGMVLLALLGWTVFWVWIALSGRWR